MLSSPGGGAVEGSPFTTTISFWTMTNLYFDEQNTPRAAAVDSVWLLRDPFSLVNLFNFSSDHHTRLMFFATGIELQPGESSSSIQVQLEDIEHHIYPLVVEAVLQVPDFPSLTQIVIKLPDSITLEGDHQITLTFRGIISNRPLISIDR